MSSDLLTYNINDIYQSKCFEWILGVILNDLMFLTLYCHPKSNLLCQKSDLLCIFIKFDYNHEFYKKNQVDYNRF